MPQKDVVLTLVSTAGALTRKLDGALSTIKGISFAEYELLAAIRDHPGGAATRVDLADAVGLSASGVTRALKPLEKLGFVETTRDARDARKSLARLTHEGVELISDAEGVVEDAVSAIAGLDDLSPSEGEALLTLLRQLTRG